jgi:hypothetical protein
MNDARAFDKIKAIVREVLDTLPAGTTGREALIACMRRLGIAEEMISAYSRKQAHPDLDAPLEWPFTPLIESWIARGLSSALVTIRKQRPDLVKPRP